MNIKRLLTVSLVFGLSLVLLATGSFGKEKEKELETFKLTLHPVAASVPALKHRLLPTIFEQKPGNAALIYKDVFYKYKEIEEELSSQGFDPALYDKWLSMPLDKFPAEAVREHRTRRLVDMVEMAATKSECNWELSLRNENPFCIELPHIGPMRKLFKIYRLQTRCDLAEGKINDALLKIRNEFVMARHAATSKNLMLNIFGFALAHQAYEDLELAIQQPGCPNLYWSLVQLPRPFIDLRESFDYEGNLLFLVAPQFRNIENDSFGAQYWQNVIERDPFVPAFSSTAGKEDRQRLAATVLILGAYPKAKRSLIRDWGYTAEQVEAMPAARVVLLHAVKTYEKIRDECGKYFALPDHEYLALSEKQRSFPWKKWRQEESLPFATLLLPAMEAAKVPEFRTTQTVDRLRVIEAIRLYADRHDGKLPERLDQITEVPVPIDINTGKPFSYCLENGTAILEYKVPSRHEFMKRYEIQIAKPSHD